MELKQILDNRYNSKTGIEFHHTITSVEEIKKHNANISHSHPQFEIYYLRQGEVYYFVGGQKYRVEEGALLLLNTFSPHHVEAEPSSILDRYVLEFTMDYIPSINGVCPAYYFFEKRHSIRIIPKEIVEKTRIFELFKGIEEETLHKNEFTAHIILGYILQIISIACLSTSEMDNTQMPEINDEYDKHTSYINEIVQYINANVDKKLTIDEIAEKVHISRSYLQHIFKKCVGLSLSEYIFRQKMHSAKYMLANGKSFTEVANALGYKYYSTFSADYKKMFGTSPKQDRLNKR